MRATDPVRPALNLPGEILGIRIPDTVLARKAATLAYEESPLFLFNHCMRVFVFSSLLAGRAAWKWDEELVFISSALHDVGLLGGHNDPAKTFEQAGADFAEKFAVAGGFPQTKAALVQEGIARHTTTGMASPIREVAMIQVGAGVDVFGYGLDGITDLERITTLAAFPREAFKLAFRGQLASYMTLHGRPAGERDWIGNFLGQADSSPWPE
jgi:hypothetical protein